MLSLLRIRVNVLQVITLVKMSTNWFFNFTNGSSIPLSSIFSLMECLSTSTCLVLSCCTGFFIFIASCHSPFLLASKTVLGIIKALAMYVTHSLVIFIWYLEFRETCSGEYRSGGTPLFLLGWSVKDSDSDANLSLLVTSFITGDNSVGSVKGSSSGANLSLLVTSFIIGDNSVEWISLTSYWTFLERSSLIVLVPLMLSETCSLTPSTCSFGTVSWQLRLLNQLGGWLVFSPWTSSWLLKKYSDYKKSQSIVIYTRWVIGL